MKNQTHPESNGFSGIRVPDRIRQVTPDPFNEDALTLFLVTRLL
ncbi:hypothetical protein KSF78_0005104 [Schistosoma japonicum]|nr:hypothetical protein KSF78_0005104 [Schistosoma japonicum]